VAGIWTIEEISIFSNSSHFEWRAGLSDTILKGDHPRTIPATFGLIWFSSFRGEDLNVSSLTYIPGFSVKFFFQPIYTDYAN
jgi:trehalose utilization protein